MDIRAYHRLFFEAPLYVFAHAIDRRIQQNTVTMSNQRLPVTVTCFSVFGVPDATTVGLYPLNSTQYSDIGVVWRIVLRL